LKDLRLRSTQYPHTYKTTPVRFAEPCWRRLFFFRSFQQMAWMGIIVLLLVLVAKVMHLPPSGAALVLICGVSGTVPSFIVSLPAKFAVEGDADAALRIIYQRLADMRFTLAGKADNEHNFIYHGSKWLRWRATHHVSLHKAVNKMAVTGSYEVLRSLRRALLRNELTPIS
jgi:hypothetical protein